MPLTMPIAKYRFRLSHCPLLITENVGSVRINHVKKNVSVEVRVTTDPASFQAALNFTLVRFFDIEFMDNRNDSAYYGLRLIGAKLIDHDFEINYGESTPAVHRYVWEYDSLEIMVNEEIETPALPADPTFPDVKTAMASLKDDLSEEDLRSGDGC